MQIERRQFLKSLPLLISPLSISFGENVNNHSTLIEKIPGSRNYIGMIEDARIRNKNIFDVPLEILVYHFHLESNFNPHAISNRLAVGIAQFMRRTAKEEGVRVYDERNNDIYSLEQEVQTNALELNSLRGKFINLFYQNQFDQAKKLKLEYDSLTKKNDKLVRQFKEKFLAQLAKDENFDYRAKPEISIEIGVKYKAKCCQMAKRKFGGLDAHNIIRGIAIYNYGPRALNEGGLPVVKETITHIRKIMAFYDKSFA